MKRVIDWFEDEHNRGQINTLMDLGVSPQSIRREQVEAEQIFADQTLVFTGALDTLTRDEAKELTRQLGGKATGSVSKNTDLVVAGPGAGSKLDKARELEIEVVDEETFLERVRKAGLEIDE